jgi:3-ketosteroid 9alpha-monooxygenase subunit A
MMQPLPMKFRAPDVGYPKGWYFVAEAADVVPGKMLPVTYLDQQFIVYRDKTGKAQVSDAFCPHLGAHLASHDGCIKNGQLVCPFHKWEFDGVTGQCTHIPYTQTMVPKSVKLRVHPTSEVDEMVLMWYHPTDSAPDYEPFTRDMLSPGARWDTHTVMKRTPTCPYGDLYENLFDTAHIQQLHHSKELLQTDVIDRMTYGLRVKMKPPKVRDSFPVKRMEVNFSGVTGAYVFNEGEGWAMLIQSTATPIDAERFSSHTRILLRNEGKLSSKIRNFVYGKAMARRTAFESDQDMNVLNYKRYLPRPNLCAGDGPIMRWRQYQLEFYPPPARAVGAE